MGWANARGRPTPRIPDGRQRVRRRRGLGRIEPREGPRLGDLGRLEDGQRAGEAAGGRREAAQADEHPPAHRAAPEPPDELGGRGGGLHLALAEPRRDLADEERQAAGGPVTGLGEGRLGVHAELRRQQLADPRERQRAPG